VGLVARGKDKLAAREIGARIAEARRAAGLTQEDLAALASFSKRSLQDYETGMTFPYRHLRELSSLLGPPVEWLLHGDPPQVNDDRFDRLEEQLEQVLQAIHDLTRLLASDEESRGTRPRGEGLPVASV